MSIFSDIGNIAKGVVNTVENVAGDVVKGAEQVAGGVAKLGEDVVGGLIQNSPLGEGFSVLKNAAQSILGELGIGGNNNNCPATGATGSTGGTDGTSGGGSIYDKIFALLQKLQDQLNQQVDSASQIDPSNQAGLQKAMFQVQQTQNLMQQIVTTATNLLKSQSDTQMSEARNFAS